MDQQPSMPPAELRRQEAAFKKAVMAVLAAMPLGTTRPKARGAEASQQVGTKWMLSAVGQPPQQPEGPRSLA